MNRRQSNKVLEIVYPSRVEGWLDAYGTYSCYSRYIHINQLNLLFWLTHFSLVRQQYPTIKTSNKCCHSNVSVFFGIKINKYKNKVPSGYISNSIILIVTTKAQK